MNYTIKIKGGQENDIPQLKPRELGYCTDTGKAFIGTETGNKDFFKVINDKIGDGFTSEKTINSQLNQKVNKTNEDKTNKYNGKFYNYKELLNRYYNNDISNLQCLCKKCHQKHHLSRNKKGQFTVK